MPLTVAFLQFLDIPTFRRTLKIGVFGALALLVAATVARARQLLPVSVCIAAAGSTVWAIPYFGQSPSHAPGDALVITGLAMFVFWRERLSELSVAVPFCAAYGAAVVYFEFLTGLLPTALGLLLPMAYLSAITLPDRRETRRAAWQYAAAVVAAFGFGAALTIALKQLITIAILDLEVLRSFTHNFRLWTGLPLADDGIPGPTDRLISPVMALLKNGTLLTYGSKSGAILVYAATALSWAAAGWLAFRRAGTRPRSDYLAFVAGAGVIVAWTLVFPAHTFRHHFMARLLMVPVALGWGALLWQLLALSRAKRVTGTL